MLAPIMTTLEAARPTAADRAPVAAGILALLLAAMLWSLNGPFVKLLDRQHVPPLAIACGRSLIAGVLFVPFALRRAGTLRRGGARWSLTAVASFTLMTVCFVLATTLTAAGSAIILQYTSAIWVFALSPLLLRERPRLIEGLPLLIAMCGIAVILSGSSPAGGLGLELALLAGLGYGVLTMALRALRNVDALVLTTLNALGSGLVLLPFVLASGAWRISASQAGWIAIMSVVQFAAPYVLFTWALKRIEAYRASLIVLLETVLNPIWTFLAVREIPEPATLIGGPLILAGVALWVMLGRRPGRAAHQ